ncbi:intermediate transcription factor VITF-3 [Pigeonpox virus]|uniref:Intermediate transcription factor 3 small subunit n=1 Tax=Pigeonpox virus TaxID=10264 RepID=A0A068EEF0_9POXV|nr:intermediate transcription factor VITF-3 [Pigeonpox virus]AID46679.1 intermediate transcription factor VITF-3 [Pigeonpox virus]WCL40120.1 intermediate transcription factor VITF-3 [Pigeonpox virus]
MYEIVPDLDTNMSLELGDFKLSTTRTKPREEDNQYYLSKNRRMYVCSSKGSERTKSLGFFLSKIPFLNYKEKNYMFQKMDNINNIQLTKKNNVISAPYVILINLSANGFKFTESFLEIYFPEIYKENSKKFKFNTQIQLIQEKLGYEHSSYYNIEFEHYYTTVCLILQSKRNMEKEDPELFDIREMSPILKSLSEITYKLYVLYIKSKFVQWSVSASAVVTQLVNTVLITVYNLITKFITENKTFKCKLAHNNELPIDMLVSYYEEFSEIITNLMKLNRYRVNKHIQETLLSFCTIFGEVE